MRQDFIKFPLHLIVHPFDSFWDMKYEGKGKIRVTLTILLLVVISMILKNQFAGFLVNYNDPRHLNSIIQLFTIVFPFFLWCLSNWAITTLMDGEGEFKEIMMATGYALVPIVIIYTPMIIASRFMAEEETAFYYLMMSISSIWFVALLFVGIMTVHQYTVLKTVVTMLLTVVVMGIVIFLGTLVLSMLQQIIEFFVNIYRELTFRT
ncbi:MULTISPECIES: YIP1 family protein [Paenibacillus]|uniref:YIP1 family protein n=1 Tax=Paenibacillus borealis TaxID=160799 RepID=A0ABX3HIM0_PAEBO|nr:YIP1 family protein [Paenibacillus borealis]OMD49156.1 YIP1 family protein [Paenibacillus borealis]